METAVKNLSRFLGVCSGIALQIGDKLKRVVYLEKLVQFAVLSEVASYRPIRSSDLLNAILRNSRQFAFLKQFRLIITDMLRF